MKRALLFGIATLCVHVEARAEVASVTATAEALVEREPGLFSSTRRGCVGPDTDAFPVESQIAVRRGTTIRHDWIDGADHVRERWVDGKLDARVRTRLTVVSGGTSGAPRVLLAPDGSWALVVADPMAEDRVVRRRQAGGYVWASGCGTLAVSRDRGGTFLIAGSRLLPATAAEDGAPSTTRPVVARAATYFVLLSGPVVVVRRFDPEGDASAAQR